MKKSNNGRASLKLKDGFWIVSLVWFLCGLLGAIPFMIYGVTDNYIDAFFESCSGFTTTGATVLVGLEGMPKFVLFWRAFSHWLGGMGIIVFAMALIPSMGINGQLVAYAETPGPSKGKIAARFSESARDMYKIYILLTIILIVLLRIGNMNWFDAVTHAFSTMGTGGFANYDASAAGFSTYIQIVIIVFMFLAGVNFNLYYLTRFRGLKTFARDEEFLFYAKIIAVASISIFICNTLTLKDGNYGKDFLDSLFQVVSVITTTGFTTCDFDLWPTFSKMMLFMLFFVGGCACSTGGGIKVSRILIALKLIKRSFSLRMHPNRVANVTFNEKEIPTDTVIKTTGFIFIYIVTLFVGTLLISLDNKDFITSFSACASCLANIGPGFNLIGPTLNYCCFGGFAKVICALLMIIGRLELYTVIVLFSKYYWNPNKC